MKKLTRTLTALMLTLCLLCACAAHATAEEETGIDDATVQLAVEQAETINYLLTELSQGEAEGYSGYGVMESAVYFYTENGEATMMLFGDNGNIYSVLTTTGNSEYVRTAQMSVLTHLIINGYVEDSNAVADLFDTEYDAVCAALEENTMYINEYNSENSAMGVSMTVMDIDGEGRLNILLNYE